MLIDFSSISHLVRHSLLLSSGSAVCYGIGRWFDKEAKASLKKAVVRYMQEGSWIRYFELFSHVAGHSIEKLLGARFITLRILGIAAVTSSIPLAYAFIFATSETTQAFMHTIYVKTHHDPSMSFIRSSIVRFGITVPFDILNLSRVRYFFKRMSEKKNFTSCIITGLILDYVIYESFKMTATQIFATSLGIPFDPLLYVSLLNPFSWVHNEQLLLNVFRISDATYHIEELLLYGYGGKAYVVASLAAPMLPSILFYFFVLALVSTRIALYTLRPIAMLSKHIKFTQPFRLVGSITGGLFACAYGLAIWLSS